MKIFIYQWLRAYVWLGLHFYFRKIHIEGRDKIPKRGAVIFTANHQNAFLDALLVVTNNGRKTHFVARAEVFKKPFIKWLLSLINMMPIYRVRDGWQSLNKNNEIFNACYKILAKKETLLIFPEGNHGFERKLRPLSKGFTRIAFGTLDLAPELSVFIVPVGINYQNHQNFWADVGIIYGDPILVNPYYNSQNEHQSSMTLRDDVSRHMKELITHIDGDNYYDILAEFEKAHVNFSRPVDHNNLPQIPIKKDGSRFRYLKMILAKLLRLNASLAFYAWTKIRGLVKDPVMQASVKFSVGIFLFPIVFLIQAMVLGMIVQKEIAGAYFILAIVTAPLMKIEQN